MRFSYAKLWKLLIDKKMVKRDLMEATGVTSSTIAKMGKEQPVTREKDSTANRREKEGGCFRGLFLRRLCTPVSISLCW